MANRWWMLIALAAVVVTLSALLLLKSRGPTTHTLGGPVAVVRPPVQDAGPDCVDATLKPTPVLPALDQATVLLIGDGQVRFAIDGEPTFSGPADPHRFPAGLREVRATGKDLAPGALTLEVEAFHAAVVLGFASQGVAVLVPFEAACPACGTSDTGVDVRFGGTATPGALEAAARALSHGQWRPAAEALRGVPPSERGEPFTLLHAAALAQASQPTTAAERLDSLGGAWRKRWSDARTALDTLAAADAAEEQKVALQRWNVVTDRFTKLADRFGTDAPGPISTANQRFNDLSKGFAKASEEHDTIEAEATVKAAQEALGALVRELRSLRPRDCAWQARVTTAQ